MANEFPTAIDGQDAVSFHDGAPARGLPQFHHDWNGQRWLFASAAHRDAFAADPARYAPQFGGHCAFAMSIGKTAHASSRQWLIEDGKLYFQQNPVARFLFRILPGRARKAHANWSQRPDAAR